MKLGIIAGSLGWHVHDLMRAAKLLSIDAMWIDITRIGSPHDLAAYDALLLRTIPAGSLEQTIFRLAVLHQVERSGQMIINTPDAFEACVDKFATTARLLAKGIPTPRTMVCQTLEAGLAAYHKLGGDVVIKPMFGSEGKGLIRVNDEDAAWRACSMLCQLGAVLYLQEYVHHPGSDLRAFVLDRQVIAAMRRSHASDWRTNVARGATTEYIALTAEQTKLAIAAAACVGADVAGVDLIEDTRNPAQPCLVLEVNGVPGWQGLAASTGIDIARKLLDYVQNRVKWSSPLARD